MKAYQLKCTMYETIFARNEQEAKQFIKEANGNAMPKYDKIEIVKCYEVETNEKI